jgi:protein TonB
MSTMWPSAIASLDDSLAAIDASLEKLEAARPIELEQVIDRLKEAAESSRKLRTAILSQAPEADWQDRGELEALLETQDALRRRAYLLALANELEYGTISHRRAARVAQLNQLREQAVDELRSLAGADKPLPLAGPEAVRWIEWASNLKEPEDTAALQALRAGFPQLDEFVAALEPGMWVVPMTPEPEVQAQAASSGELPPHELEQRRSRLLALASELERGEVVHHRAIRVTQVNQLREPAIQELRFQAVVARMPAILPGPEAEQWVHWACSLKEPEDTESLQYLRNGFEHLDEFVANLEPGMWVSAGAARPDQASAAERYPEQPQEQPLRNATTEREAPQAAPAPAVTQRKEPAVPAPVVADSETSPGFADRLKAAFGVLSRGKLRVVLPTAVLLLAVLGAMQWRLHRTNASTPAKVPDGATTETATVAPDAGTSTPALKTASSTANPPALNEKTPKPKDANNAAKSPTTPPPPPEKQVSLLNATSLRTPQAMPKTAVAKGEDLINAPDVTGQVPGGVPNGMNNLVKDVSVAAPKLPAQKIRVSSGVAQGQLIHQVTPVYPLQAKLSGIQGTVVLQAVVGKDGSVQNVHAVRGPSMLIPSALDAVKPFSVNGEPAEADIEVNVKFNP